MTVSEKTPAVALVTGGAGGLGSAIAKRFVEAGDTVYVVDADESAVKETADRIATDLITATVIGIGGDVREERSNRGIIERISRDHGRLDRLINAAGVGGTAEFGRIKREEWSRVLEINLWGMASLTQEAASIWSERPGGAVVNLGSRSWLSGGNLAYSSSKAGVVGLTRSLAVELGRFDVRANAVVPGTFLTSIVTKGKNAEELAEHVARAESYSLMGRIASVADVVDAVEFLAGDNSSFITGEVLNVAGGAQLAPFMGS